MLFDNFRVLSAKYTPFLLSVVLQYPRAFFVFWGGLDFLRVKEYGVWCPRWRSRASGVSLVLSLAEMFVPFVTSMVKTHCFFNTLFVAAEEYEANTLARASFMRLSDDSSNYGKEYWSLVHFRDQFPIHVRSFFVLAALSVRKSLGFSDCVSTDSWNTRTAIFCEGKSIRISRVKVALV